MTELEEIEVRERERVLEVLKANAAYLHELPDGAFDFEGALLDVPMREDVYLVTGRKSKDTRFLAGVDEIVVDEMRRLYLVEGEDTISLVLDYDEVAFEFYQKEQCEEEGCDDEEPMSLESMLELESPDYEIRGFLAALINLARHERVCSYASSSYSRKYNLDLSLSSLAFNFRTPIKGLCETYLNYVRKNYTTHAEYKVLEPDPRRIAKGILENEEFYERNFFDSPIYSKLLRVDQMRDLKRYCNAFKVLLHRETGEADVEKPVVPKEAEKPKSENSKKDYCKYIVKKRFPTEDYTLDEFEEKLGEKSKLDAATFCKFLMENEKIGVLDFSVEKENVKCIHKYLKEHFPMMREYTYTNFNQYFSHKKK